MSEIREFLKRHLQAIFDGDVAAYKATTAADPGLYEWYIIRDHPLIGPIMAWFRLKAPSCSAT